MARQKSFSQMLADGKRRVAAEAQKRREDIDKRQFELDEYTKRRMIPRNTWGM